MGTTIVWRFLGIGAAGRRGAGSTQAGKKHLRADTRHCRSNPSKPCLGDGAVELRLGGLIRVEEIVPDG